MYLGVVTRMMYLGVVTPSSLYDVPGCGNPSLYNVPGCGTPSLIPGCGNPSLYDIPGCGLNPSLYDKAWVW